jgi:L-asparaginase / beta-aspartyl-peptidase
MSRQKSSRAVLVVHGGAGTLSASELTPRRVQAYRAGIERALRAGNRVLQNGGPALDAVMHAVEALENNPLFNAGRGAVYNAAGQHELDAAIMDGATLRAGAVAGVRHIKNPVRAARAVMERTRHVLLAGGAADRFARHAGLDIVPGEYFDTARRRAALKRVQERERSGGLQAASAADRHGTVGAVALDAAGDLAAATSTGGYTNKMAGRVGDSPVIGAGTYADNETCAVSGTGDGEFFIRAALGYDITARMRYLREPLQTAARHALARVTALGGSGGLIALDRRGRIAMPFSSAGMYRGHISGAAAPYVAIL